MELLYIFLAAFVIGAAYILEAVTSFGSGIIALPFLSALIGIKTAVPVLACVSCLFTAYVVAVNRNHIRKKEYFTIIGCAIPGIPLGMLAFSTMNESVLKLILGIFVLAAALRSVLAHKGIINKSSSLPNPVYYLLLFFGGIVQGAFVTGGPLIVLYSAYKIKDKSEFRATMCAVWLTLNSLLIIGNLIAGDVLTTRVFSVVGISIPLLIVGVFVGWRLHKKVSADKFFSLVYFVLFASGVSMIVNALIG